MGRGYKLSKSRDYRRIKPELVGLVITLVIIVGVALYIYLDLSQNSLIIDSSRNNPDRNYIASQDIQFKTIEEQQYLFDVPANWQRVQNPEIIIDARRFYPYRYRGTDDKDVGRRIDIYWETVPELLPVSKLLQVRLLGGDRIVAEELSESCYNFTPHPDNMAGSPYPSTWNGHSFRCDTGRHINTIAAVIGNLGEGITLAGPSGTSYRFLVVYTDHGSSMNNNIFNRIMESFRVK